ncbi:helix-turn-helix domain-containing protein [Taibaiella koreensis]|uniref:helix-turn-helix domain-containing protein n=1 Tax=Taibaiella koreensis TaxID=1268548 RepID=UPI000E59B7F3|nr:AraC family transcriptional regulator [Taibaiella koreensis]
MKKIPTRRLSPEQQESAFAEQFLIRDIPSLLKGADLVQELHRHDFYYLLALQQGSGEHSIDFNTYPVSDHSLFIMRPGQVHRLRLQAGSTGYLVQFGTGFTAGRDNVWQQALQHACRYPYYNAGRERMTQLLHLLDALAAEIGAKQEPYKDAVAAYVYLFLVSVQRLQERPPHATGLYRQEQLDAFRTLLEAHSHEQKLVAYYAQQLHLSPYQLNAITKALLNKTCSEMIADQVLLEARRYLLGTKSQVKEIAARLGFDDVAYFIRFFRKHTGISPGAFRDKNPG